MNVISLSATSRGLSVVAGLFIGVSALAAPASAPSDAQARYLKDKAVCDSGQSNQDRATCLKEAGAALDAARQGELNDRGAKYKRNALERCKSLPADQRAECAARMRDGITEGSAASGGILREKVTREVGKPESAASDPAPMSVDKAQ